MSLSGVQKSWCESGGMRKFLTIDNIYGIYLLLLLLLFLLRIHSVYIVYNVDYSMYIKSSKRGRFGASKALDAGADDAVGCLVGDPNGLALAAVHDAQPSHVARRRGRRRRRRRGLPTCRKKTYIIYIVPHIYIYIIVDIIYYVYILHTIYIYIFACIDIRYILQLSSSKKLQ